MEGVESGTDRGGSCIMGRFVFTVICLAGILAGCAGTLPVRQEGALPRMPLSDLIANVDTYTGQSVVMGGFVLEVENKQKVTRILAVQVPIDSWQRLKSRDLSEGRLLLFYDGFIDPEVYTKGRGFTVGGDILGGSDDDPEVPYPYLRIKVRDIYLWPEESPAESDERFEYDPFYPWWWYRPYLYRAYPYYWDPYWRSYWYYQHRK